MDSSNNTLATTSKASCHSTPSKSGLDDVDDDVVPWGDDVAEGGDDVWVTKREMVSTRRRVKEGRREGNRLSTCDICLTISNPLHYYNY